MVGNVDRGNVLLLENIFIKFIGNIINIFYLFKNIVIVLNNKNMVV